MNLLKHKKKHNLYIIPYKLGSESARNLSRELGALRTVGDKYFSKPSVIINWGNSKLPTKGNIKAILNGPTAVALSKNKYLTLDKLKYYNVPTVEFTRNQEVAKQWYNDGHIVYGRHTLFGQAGEGIEVITEDTLKFPSCPLYTKGVVKAHEYRVHVCAGKAFDFAKKRRRSEGNNDDYIKNLEGGWVFCREGVTLPKEVEAAAVRAVSALCLDFGAVDILYKEKDNRVYVLEINTAPGLEGVTLLNYSKVLKDLLIKL
jgi:glutathione synthase/RimK-type ligase-like ATP-grasp enzyme